MVEELNNGLQPYYDGLNDFQQELELLKTDYIGDSARRSLQEKYRFIEVFFKGTTIEHAASFLELYSNLETFTRT